MAAVAVVLLGVLVLAGPPAAARPAPLAELRRIALDLVNAERTERGLPPLTLAADLDAAAQGHAEDMLARDYYAHASPEGKQVMDRYVAAGGSGWRLVAENIAHCPACAPPLTRAAVRELTRGWMASAHHRENILDPGLDQFGFGIVAGRDGGLYAVQTFAGPGTAHGAEPGQPSAALLVDEQERQALNFINSARRNAGLRPLSPSGALVSAARVILAARREGDLDRQPEGALFSAVPAAARQDWRSLALILGACGGCGAKPVAADLRYFRDRWLSLPEYGRTLLDPAFTHLGFAILADGRGRKVLVALLGQHR
jgi:uncharacterized protein YkwD